MRRRELLIFAAFFVGALILRSSTFFQSTMGSDESLYVIMGRELLHGRLPYVDLVDQKPFGIFVLFGLIQLVLGKSIFAIRLAACLFNAAGCWALWRAGNTLAGSARTGLVAGVAFLFFSLGNHGLEANTEIFYTPLVVMAFVWLLYRPLAEAKLPSLRQCAAAGLAFGVALTFKTVVAFDGIAAAIAVLLVVRELGGGDVRAIARRWAVLAGGAILPTVLCIAFYAARGHLGEFMRYNVHGNLMHRADNVLSGGHLLVVLKSQILERNLLPWLGTGIAAVLLWRKQFESRERVAVTATLGWLVLGFAGLSFTKAYYDHYFLQILPAQCLLLAIVVERALGELAAPRRQIALSLVLLTPFAQLGYLPLADGMRRAMHHLVRHEKTYGDTPAEIAAYLAPHVPPERTLYVADYRIIIEYLVPSAFPTKYLFPEFLNDPHFARVVGIDAVAELDKIMATKPIYVVCRRSGNSDFYRRLADYLRSDYILDRAFEEADTADWQHSDTPEQDRFIELYRRRE